jgi:hypothetical protein
MQIDADRFSGHYADFNCVRCGFYSVTESVEPAGKKFWKVTMEMPVSKDGRVAWPELVPINPDHKWNRKDYGVCPATKRCRKSSEPRKRKLTASPQSRSLR